MKRKSFDDLIGTVFNSGECIGVGDKRGRKHLLIRCVNCNQVFYLKPCNAELIKSCGCMVDNHGFSTHPLYNIIGAIINRCNNKKDIGYHRYGGRGIFVCEEWAKNRPLFVKWALENGWQKGLQVDRINNDDGYYPDNCRIVTRKDNLRNTRKTSFIINNGKKELIKDIAERLGMNVETLYYRNRKKWPYEELIKPILNNKIGKNI